MRSGRKAKKPKTLDEHELMLGEHMHAVLDGATILRAETTYVDVTDPTTGVAIVLYLDNGWAVNIAIAKPGIAMGQYRVDKVQ